MINQIYLLSHTLSSTCFHVFQNDKGFHDLWRPRPMQDCNGCDDEHKTRKCSLLIPFSLHLKDICTSGSSLSSKNTHIYTHSEGSFIYKWNYNISVECSQTFTPFWSIKTAVPVEISWYSFRVFSCAYPTVISSIPGKSFHFPFPYFVIFILWYFPFHVVGFL